MAAGAGTETRRRRSRRAVIPGEEFYERNTSRRNKDVARNRASSQYRTFGQNGAEVEYGCKPPMRRAIRLHEEHQRRLARCSSCTGIEIVVGVLVAGGEPTPTAKTFSAPVRVERSFAGTNSGVQSEAARVF